jgi:hypothetical protein
MQRPWQRSRAWTELHLGTNKVIVETDSIILGEALKTTTRDMSPYGALFRQIRDLMIYELLDFFCIGL